jgi:hypothetical protein
MVVEGTRKGDVEGPNPAGYETCDKCLDLLFVWCDFRRVADRWEPPRIKKIAIFWPISWFLKTTPLPIISRPYKSAISSNGLVGAAGKTVARDHFEPPLYKPWL